MRLQTLRHGHGAGVCLGTKAIARLPTCRRFSGPAVCGGETERNGPNFLKLSPRNIYDGELCPLQQELAAKDGLRAQDRHLIATFRSAHCLITDHGAERRDLQ
jgi:hypothetical protein